jgi:hypothetical protein
MKAPVSITFEAYTQIDAEHWSGLKHVRRSPLHYQYRRGTPLPDTNRLALGRGCHTAVFEPDRLLIEYALFKGKIRRGKAWDAFREQHAEETILKVDEYGRALAIRDAVRRHPVAAKYLSAGKAEQTITWTDRETGIRCKARIDWLGQAVVDLKSTKDVDAFKFAALVARMLYHGQLAFYADGVREALGLELPAVIIAVEVDAPHDVAVYRLGPDEIQVGRSLYRSLLRLVAECRQADSWPGRYPEELILRLPAWSFEVDTSSDDADEDISDIFQPAEAHAEV